jgi:hypothetical protein
MDSVRRQNAFLSDLERITQLHREGLLRVCKVVDANPNYDDLLEFRLSGPEWEAFAPQVPLAQMRQRAIEMFEQKFRSRRHKIILPEFQGVTCDGKTRNNLREFAFFDRICSPLRISDRNYGHCQTISVSDLQPAEAAAQEAIIADVVGYYGERTDLTASVVRQQILYSHSFFSFILSFTRPGAVLPSILVQANDHSPGYVSLSMVFKGLGIPRAYLQHAEVTRNFPPLDFDYSVLRNEQSREIYESIAPPKGKVYVIPRYEEAFARDRLGVHRGDGVTVVIYPTGTVILDELRAIVDALSSNPKVARIGIKQHPGAARRLDDAFLGTRVEMIDVVPSEDHIAIVGNSSVAIELLHRGVPVYQNFSFDPVSRDYYGLVAAGMTQEANLADLAGKFWRPYDLSRAWLDQYGRLDPTAGEDYLADQTAFVDQMQYLQRTIPPSATPTRPMKGRFRARLKGWAKRGAIRAVALNPPLASAAANLILNASHRFGTFLTVNSYYGTIFLQTRLKLNIKVPVWATLGRGDSMASSAELIPFLEQTLAGHKEPVAWIRQNEVAKIFSTEAVISAVDAMFQNRRPELNAVFEGYTSWPAGSDVGTWTYLKKAEWGNMNLPPEEVSSIASFIYAYQGNARVRALLERSLLGTIFRGGTGEQLDEFWRNAKAVRRDSLNFTLQVALLRKLRSLPGRAAEAERQLAETEALATPFERLKLKNMEFLAGAAVPPEWSHAYAEAQFGRLAPAQIARDFADHGRPAYNALRPRMRFMELRGGNAQSAELLDSIRASLKDRRPFSLIRLSDGEGYLFPDGPHFSPEDRANRERHWWGVELADGLRSQIVTEARAAIATADVVGIPAVYRLIRDYGDASFSMTQSVQGRGLLQVLNGVGATLAPQALVAEDKVNVSLFGRHEDLLSLAREARRLIIVGSVLPEHLPTELVGANTVDVILLPTHARTALNGKYHFGAERLPFVYPSLIEELDSRAGPGDLVLVAGGIIGKIFVGSARRKGAVALDIGSVIDDWISGDLAPLR